MLYISIATFIMTLFSSIFIYGKCKNIEKSKDSALPMYEILVCTYKLPPIFFYIIPNLILMGLILWFRFIKLDISAFNIYELVKVFCISQVGFYLICRDLKTFIIPNKITLPVICGLLVYSLLPPFFCWQNILYAILAFAIIFVLQIINPNGIGGGDAKLCAILGFMMGSYMQSIFFVLAGFVLGGLVNILFLASKLIKRKDFVPYGVYFYIGACLIYAFSNFIFIQ